MSSDVSFCKEDQRINKVSCMGTYWFLRNYDGFARLTSRLDEVIEALDMTIQYDYS